MTLLWTKIQEFSQSHSDELALIGEAKSYSWSQLESEVKKASLQLSPFQNKVLALYENNSPEWIIVDLACRLNQIILLPLPAFFSDQQLFHAIKQAGISAILATDTARLMDLIGDFAVEKNSTVVAGLSLSVLNQPVVRLPENTSKITFTSGSTGQPKGVCLSNEQQTNVAQALLKAIDLGATRHLSILPFSTLLENIGGVYAPLLSGGSVIALSQEALGFNGSNGFDLATLTSTISHYQPQSMIVLPELLMALTGAIQQGWQVPKSLRFIAVGGSKVSPSLLQNSQTLGLPVYEGYGLSECGSVVSLNSPKNTAMGSIGKVLDHVSVTIENEEIVVSGNPFLGYINDADTWLSSKVYTGDLGFFDEHGYLHIKGRKKNLLISSFGRNINPEWVESELLANGLLQHAVLFGDAKPYCISLLQPRDISITDDVIQKMIDAVNQSLPNYAQVKAWARVPVEMTIDDGLITSNGRPVRNKIYQQHKILIEQLYDTRDH